MACQKRAGELLPGFVKADTRNLPRVDIFMVVEHYKHQVHPAMKHCKLQRSAGEEYGDDAVAYVQLKREGGQCEVQARITPEHKVTSKPYRVVAVIDEVKEEVAEVRCEDCAASAGGCKHAAAFLGWLERRSADKSVTSVESYWAKSRLSSVGCDVKVASAGQLRKRPRREEQARANLADEFFASVMRHSVSQSSGVIFDHFGSRACELDDIGVDRLLTSYLARNDEQEKTCDGFLQFCSSKMTDEVCKLVQQATQGQGKSPLWHAMRFGRVTASKAYDAAHCKQANGSLMLGILGASRLKDSAAMARGRALEPAVIREVEKQVGEKIASSGILLSSAHPALGASPDGITVSGTSIVEVKCPTSGKALQRYLCRDGSVASKHVAQVQMLMHMAKCRLAYFCVADPSFETTRQVTIKCLQYDAAYCHDLLTKSEAFWRAAVFVELVKARAQ